MTEYEKLVLEVETRGARASASELARLDAAVARTQEALDELQRQGMSTSGAFDRLTRSQNSLVKQTSVAANSQALLSRAYLRAYTDLRKLDTATATASSGFAKLSLTALRALRAVNVLALLHTLKQVAQTVAEGAKSFEDFNNQLTIITGGADRAKVAYAALMDFAVTTPYTLDQAVDSFTKLVNFGLNPSERAMRAYGDIASSTNKELVQMVQAVSSATQNNFVRLKQFGIGASKQGDAIVFSFRGVKTAVHNDARSIEEYLIKLGENNFAGAMAARMQTLSGAMSNLDDEWLKFTQNISQVQVGDHKVAEWMALGVRELTDALKILNTELTSGNVDRSLYNYSLKWRTTFEDISDHIAVFKDNTEGAFASFGKFDTVESLALKGFWAALNSPEEINLFLSKLNATLATAVAMFDVFSGSVLEAFIATFNSIATAFELVLLPKLAGAILSSPLKHLLSATVVADLEATAAGIVKLENILTQLREKVRDAFSDDDAQIATLYRALLNDFAAIDRTINSTIAQARSFTLLKPDAGPSAAANLLGGASDVWTGPGYIQSSGDRLGQFAQQGPGAHPEAPATATAATGARVSRGATAADQAVREEEQLQQRLLDTRIRWLEEGFQNEGQVLSSEYEEQRDYILNNAELTATDKQNIIMRIMTDGVVSEEEELRMSYERRRAFILSSTALTYEAKQALIAKLDKKHAKEDFAVLTATQREKLQSVSTFFGDLASIGSAFGKKGFKLAQAAAIAEATVQMYLGATAAYTSGAKIGGPILGAVFAAAAVAAGTANIVKIKSQEYSGAYAMGGAIPAGKYGLVGEAGPEFVRGPAIVTSAQASRSRLGPVAPKIEIRNLGAPVQAEAQWDEERLLLVLQPHLDATRRRVKSELRDEVARGGSPFTQTIERTYGVGRARTNA